MVLTSSPRRETESAPNVFTSTDFVFAHSAGETTGASIMPKAVMFTASSSSETVYVPPHSLPLTRMAEATGLDFTVMASSVPTSTSAPLSSAVSSAVTVTLPSKVTATLTGSGSGSSPPPGAGSSPPGAGSSPPGAGSLPPSSPPAGSISSPVSATALSSPSARTTAPVSSTAAVGMAGVKPTSMDSRRMTARTLTSVFPVFIPLYSFFYFYLFSYTSYNASFGLPRWL